jgi:hypothetical protein
VGEPLFTGGVSTPPPAPPQPPSVAGPRWHGWPEIRSDLRNSAWLVAALVLAGLPAGVLWWLLAPRADYRITADGPAVLGNPSEELLVADDAVFVLVLAGIGLVCGAAAWWLRRRRGVATLLALAVGTGLAAVVAWQVGELLGAGPSQVELADVGAVVTTSLTLGSLPGLAIAPFAAVLAYVFAALYVADDGLGREPGARVPPTALPDADPVEEDRPLVGRPEV